VSIRPRIVQTALLKLRRSLGKTLQKFKQAQGENSLLVNEEADGENQSPAQKKRRLSLSHNHESAAATKRAKNTHHNTTDETLSDLTAALLRLPEANSAAAFRFQKRTRGTYHTTADEDSGLLALQSEPPSVPEANPTASLQFQKRTNN
jgi:hypothetical protein